jgi:hypothetical protein
MKKSVISTLLVSLVLVTTGGAVYHEEISEFIGAMRPVKMEATISFGKALDPSGKFVSDPATTFNLGENVAWVVHFQKNAGTKELVVALFELTKDGREIPLDRNRMAVEPTDVGLYNFTTTQAFWSLSPKATEADRRTYRVKYLKKRVVAQGDFTILRDAKDGAH